MDKNNPADTAVVEQDEKNKINSTPVYDSSAKIQLIKNDNDIITYSSKSNTNQFAVFSEIYYDRGWKAYIDNKEVPIVRTDYVLRGLSIPAGNHNIRFEFKPASFYIAKPLKNCLCNRMVADCFYGNYLVRRKNQIKLYKLKSPPMLSGDFIVSLLCSLF